VEIPLPWERLIWQGRPAFAPRTRERYFLTDLRLVRTAGDDAEEILLQEIGEVQKIDERFDPILGTSTLLVSARNGRRRAVTLRRVRHAPQLAALLEWLSSEPADRRRTLDANAVAAAMSWTPRTTAAIRAKVLSALAATLAALFGVVIGLHGTSRPAASYGPDDAIYPAGVKRSQPDIIRYMESEIMPWARGVLGPLKGGADRVTCETCHGPQADARAWRMPAVGVLPQPDVRERGWELYGGPMDAQMRNAIYGYLAESDKQTKAAYMREIVMPGMARLLHRPPYDFTQPYEYNRSRLAFGCYHCHRVN
jgi:hypothetical protein